MDIELVEAIKSQPILKKGENEYIESRAFIQAILATAENKKTDNDVLMLHKLIGETQKREYIIQEDNTQNNKIPKKTGMTTKEFKELIDKVCDKVSPKTKGNEQVNEEKGIESIKEMVKESLRNHIQVISHGTGYQAGITTQGFNNALIKLKTDNELTEANEKLINDLEKTFLTKAYFIHCLNKSDNDRKGMSVEDCFKLIDKRCKKEKTAAIEREFMNPPTDEIGAYTNGIGSSISGKRTSILINNLLAEICDKTDICKDEYESWLEEEVGFTKAEIIALKEENCFPEPLTEQREL